MITQKSQSADGAVRLGGQDAEQGIANGRETAVKSRFLSLLPDGTRILRVQSYRPGYAFYPARVSVQTPEGGGEHYVLKRGSDCQTILREARTLRALRELGLPVPAVFACTAEALEAEETDFLLVMSELPGRALPSIGIDSLTEADVSCQLLVEGVTRLHGLTERVSEHPIAGELPKWTLIDELDSIVRDAGDWMRVDLFALAVNLLSELLPRLPERLVFSNGDYNPLNFLCDGKNLTGFVDFEAACFEDPHIGFAKFVIWSNDDFGWGMARKAGLVERYLYSQNVSRQEFAPRLVLRCLRHILTEVSVEGGDASHREYRLQIISDNLKDLSGNTA